MDVSWCIPCIPRDSLQYAKDIRHLFLSFGCFAHVHGFEPPFASAFFLPLCGLFFLLSSLLLSPSSLLLLASSSTFFLSTRTCAKRPGAIAAVVESVVEFHAAPTGFFLGKVGEPFHPPQHLAGSLGRKVTGPASAFVQCALVLLLDRLPHLRHHHLLPTFSLQRLVGDVDASVHRRFLHLPLRQSGATGQLVHRVGHRNVASDVHGRARQALGCELGHLASGCGVYLLLDRLGLLLHLDGGGLGCVFGPSPCFFGKARVFSPLVGKHKPPAQLSRGQHPARRLRLAIGDRSKRGHGC